MTELTREQREQMLEEAVHAWETVAEEALKLQMAHFAEVLELSETEVANSFGWANLSLSLSLIGKVHGLDRKQIEGIYYQTANLLGAHASGEIN